jgi:hypothetical protein
VTRMKKGVFLLLLFSLAVPASAAIDKIVFEVDSLSVNTAYSAATHQLVWSKGGLATIRYDGGITQFRVTFNGTWSDMTDLTSPGGPATASFGTGTFGASFYALNDAQKLHSLGSAGGTLYDGFHYNERETQDSPSELYGAAVVQLTSWNITGYDWSEGLYSAAGLTATTSNINPPGIVDYQSNWNSNNTIITLMADESGIPEPATMCLLGLGAALIRRKRS